METVRERKKEKTRHHEYLIISNSFDQPRCQECFMKLRAQTSALPLTRHHEYLIISNSFDQPRCQECFMKLRAQTSALPLTITSSPMDSCSPGASSEGGAADKVSPQSPLSLVIDSKRPRID
uniref:Stc1 domain-containing protein n=1 Tax=Ascaris lumbricoides TaxID=6252 RepID=A0A0M3IAK6_ASCLU